MVCILDGDLFYGGGRSRVSVVKRKIIYLVVFIRVCVSDVCCVCVLFADAAAMGVEDAETTDCRDLTGIRRDFCLIYTVLPHRQIKHEKQEDPRAILYRIHDTKKGRITAPILKSVASEISCGEPSFPRTYRSELTDTCPFSCSRGVIEL